jgi:hypothetical protein
MQNRALIRSSRGTVCCLQAEFGFKPNPKMQETLTTALNSGIPFIVLFGSTVNGFSCYPATHLVDGCFTPLLPSLSYELLPLHV